MKSKSMYYEGHLLVAAVRILEHRNGAPPALDQLSELLGFTAEQTGLTSRRLRDAGIIKQVEGAFGDRWAVHDHLKLEELPRDTEAGQLDTELRKFQSERDKIAQKVASIKEQQAQKQKNLFADIEKKLKKDLSKE